MEVVNTHLLISHPEMISPISLSESTNDFRSIWTTNTRINEQRHQKLCSKSACRSIRLRCWCSELWYSPSLHKKWWEICLKYKCHLVELINPGLIVWKIGQFLCKGWFSESCRGTFTHWCCIWHRRCRRVKRRKKRRRKRRKKRWSQTSSSWRTQPGWCLLSSKFSPCLRPVATSPSNR